MSHAVARSQTGAKSKECTLFFTLRAILQSPQPKSATTKEAGLKKKKKLSDIQCLQDRKT